LGAVIAALAPAFPHIARIALEKDVFISRLKFASLKLLILLIPARRAKIKNFDEAIFA
jgi:hypothetical protein